MQRITLSCVVAVILLSQQVKGDDEQVFSGPQVGEKLVPFAMKGVLGETAEKDLDLIAQANGGPAVIVFFRERTRPAFSLTNTVMRMAASRKKNGLTCGVCFLTDDPTDTANWMQRIPQYFTEGVAHGISTDGQEGPGAYGLNRNVALTVLVGKGNRVTANFALVQPSVQADATKIFEAVVEVTGGGEVPELSEFAQNRYGDQVRLNPRLVQLLRPLQRKDAAPQDVERAAAAVEEFLTNNERAQRQLGQFAVQQIRSGRLNRVGTEEARAKLKLWAGKYGGRPATRTKQD